MDEKLASVPLIIYEKERDRHERELNAERNKHEKSSNRKLAVIILLIILLFASNIVWIVVWNQYETVSYTQDGEGINNVNIGEQGDLINESESDYTTENTSP